MLSRNGREKNNEKPRKIKLFQKKPKRKKCNQAWDVCVASLRRPCFYSCSVIDVHFALEICAIRNHCNIYWWEKKRWKESTSMRKQWDDSNEITDWTAAATAAATEEAINKFFNWHQLARASHTKNVNQWSWHARARSPAHVSPINRSRYFCFIEFLVPHAVFILLSLKRRDWCNFVGNATRTNSKNSETKCTFRFNKMNNLSIATAAQRTMTYWISHQSYRIQFSHQFFPLHFRNKCNSFNYLWTIALHKKKSVFSFFPSFFRLFVRSFFQSTINSFTVFRSQTGKSTTKKHSTAKYFALFTHKKIKIRLKSAKKRNK